VCRPASGGGRVRRPRAAPRGSEMSTEGAEPTGDAAQAPRAWPAPVWRFAPFDSLTARELQYIYMARQAVFSVEQQCAFMDADGLDERAYHLAAWSRVPREPLAYARLLEPGAKYAEPSIGRVITTAAARGPGPGRGTRGGGPAPRAALPAPS